MSINTHPQTAATTVTTSDRPRLVEFVIKTGLNALPYWRTLVVVVAVSVAASVYISDRFASTTYKIGGAMIYHPLPLDQSADGLYSPPDLRTLTSLVNSAPVLQKAITSSGTETTPRLLSRDLSVFEPRSTQRIGMVLNASDPAQGIETLSAICQAAQDCIADMRREVVGKTLKDVEASRERSERRVKSAQEQLLQFTGRLKVDDVDSEVKDLAAEVALLEFKLKSAEIEEQGFRVQHKLVEKQLTDQKQKEKELNEAEQNAETAAESLSDNRRRQDRLNELIREERRLNEVRAQLDARQNEFSRKMKLYEKGYISRSEFEEIESKVKELKAQIMEGPKITNWKTELERIDKVIVPKSGKSKSAASPLIYQTMYKLFELDLQVNNSQELQRQIALKQVEVKRRRQQLRLFQQEQAGLQMEIKAANDEHDSLNRQISALTALYEMGPLELTVAEAPSAVMQMPTSDRKKLFVLVMAASLLLLTSPVALLAALASLRSTVRECALTRGLALLSPRKSILEANKRPRGSRGVKWERQVALRIQQLVPQVGSVVSILPAKSIPTDEQIVTNMASILQLREETVLLIKLGNPPLPNPNTKSLEVLERVSRSFGQGISTLSDYLEHETVLFDDTYSCASDNVKIVHGGEYDPEMLFSRRMSEYLAHARKHFSIILLYGMDLSETTNIEMLARHSNGIVLLHDRKDSLNRDMQRTVDNLIEVGAPIFGNAIRPLEPRKSWFRRRPPKAQSSIGTKQPQSESTPSRKRENAECVGPKEPAGTEEHVS